MKKLKSLVSCILYFTLACLQQTQPNGVQEAAKQQQQSEKRRFKFTSAIATDDGIPDVHSDSNSDSEVKTVVLGDRGAMMEAAGNGGASTAALEKGEPNRRSFIGDAYRVALVILTRDMRRALPRHDSSS